MRDNANEIGEAAVSAALVPCACSATIIRIVPFPFRKCSARQSKFNRNNEIQLPMLFR
jgi:hypothetical protein